MYDFKLLKLFLQHYYTKRLYTGIHSLHTTCITSEKLKLEERVQVVISARVDLGGDSRVNA